MAAVLLSNTMAQNHNSNVNNDVKPTTFHEFLGGECAPVPNCAATCDASAGGSPSASASRAGGPFSTTSDLVSDRQVGSHIEGVPLYGQRSDISGSNIGNRYAGSKRSNSDSVFLDSLRDVAPQMRPNFPDSSHLKKMLKSVVQEEPIRPILQQTTVAKHDSNPSKPERAIPVNVGPVRSGQPTPYPYQPVSNKFKDPTMGASVISQSAADEGSRTGIRGSGILNSSTPSLRQPGPASASRQLTIFYGGQAHVFDDVHPNKADAIMAMAGTSGGSWSTNYSQNSTIKPSIRIGENNTLPIREGLISIHGAGLSDRMPLIYGRQMTDARRPSQATEEKP